MKAFLVVVENINNTNIRRIRAYGAWARIASNCYVIISGKTASEVRDELCEDSEMMGNKLFVVDITNKGWGSYGIDKEVAEWLKTQLRR